MRQPASLLHAEAEGDGRHDGVRTREKPPHGVQSQHLREDRGFLQGIAREPTLTLGICFGAPRSCYPPPWVDVVRVGGSLGLTWPWPTNSSSSSSGPAHLGSIARRREAVSSPLGPYECSA